MRLMTTAGALIAAALVGGTLIGSAAASSGAAEADPATALAALGDGAYCDLYLDTLSAELGVELADIAPAARAAATTTIEAMIENGDLPADVGQRMLDRLADTDGSGCAALGLRFSRALHAAGVADWLPDASGGAADALGIEVGELRERQRNGESLAEIAEAEGVDYATVSAAVLAATQADLDAAVEAGRLTQARADRILERVTGWLDAGGETRRHRVGH
jgi:hypothetical protein